MHRSFVAALLCAVLLVGCKSDAEKLIELRSDLRARLEELYGRYGGGALANQANADAREGATDDGRGTAARFLGEMDRSYFEGYCLAHGRGERPFNLSGKLDAFMKDGENQKACREAAKLASRIQELEAKAGGAAPAAY